MAVYADRVEFRNPNVPHYFGRIDPNRFTPFPKNPTICKFMLQMGRYEELGSGVRRVNQYLPHYAPGADRAVFEDGDMFSVTVPLAGAGTAQVEVQVTGEVTGEVAGEVARFLRALVAGPMTRTGSQKVLGLKGQANFRNRYLKPTLDAGLVEMTIPEKPNSRLQKYRLTDRGRRTLKRFEGA
jgi:ATP-dependent DNA helicase RecG